MDLSRPPDRAAAALEASRWSSQARPPLRPPRPPPEGPCLYPAAGTPPPWPPPHRRCRARGRGNGDPGRRAHHHRRRAGDHRKVVPAGCHHRQRRIRLGCHLPDGPGLRPARDDRRGTDRQKATAIGAGTAPAAASYLISSLAPVASWIRPARYASLFYWSVGNSQISHGISPASYAVLIITGLCALAAATLAFRRLDIH